MRIVQIGSFPLDTTCIRGGVEASVYGLSAVQVKRHALIVVDIPRTGIISDAVEEIDGVKVFRFRSKGSNTSSIFRLGPVMRIIKSHKPDVCHIHSTGLFSFILFVMLRLQGIAALVTVHGLAHIEKQNVWKREKNIRNFIKYISQSLTEFIFLSVCRIIIVDTGYVADAIRGYKKQGKIFRMPVCKVIPQGINPVFFNLENKPNPAGILSVGAINKRKGHLTLIEAMQKVYEVFPAVRLDIVGAMSDKSYYEKLIKLIAEKKLDGIIRIHVNAGFNHLLELYREAGIFVLHSQEESQGIVFCEAMAAGKPVVATNVGGIPWVIKNNVNGLLSGYGDSDTFAQHIICLLKNEKQRKEMSEINREQSRMYDWQIIANDIMAVYKSVINP